MECSRDTTLDDFREAVLVGTDDGDFETPHGKHFEPDRSPLATHHFRPARNLSYQASSASNTLDERRVAEVVIAKNLNQANNHVQIQALELIRTKRLYSSSAMHGTSKKFLFVALHGTTPRTGLTHHLNELFSISHHHSIADGLPNLEDARTRGIVASDSASTISGQSSDGNESVFTPTELDALRSATDSVRLTAEVAAYLHNIVVFMRLNRYVGGGASASATRHFRRVSKALAPLHGLTYVSPSLVALAARKVYPHRLVLATPTTERSLQWGSDVEAVREMLKDVSVADAIEDVLSSVETPL